MFSLLAPGEIQFNEYKSEIIHVVFQVENPDTRLSVLHATRFLLHAALVTNSKVSQVPYKAFVRYDGPKVEADTRLTLHRRIVASSLVWAIASDVRVPSSSTNWPFKLATTAGKHGLAMPTTAGHLIHDAVTGGCCEGDETLGRSYCSDLKGGHWIVYSFKLCHR